MVDSLEDPRRVDPPFIADERHMLEAWLEFHRITLLMKCEGLNPEQLARRSVPPSTMSLLGLLRHLAGAELAWRDWISDGDPRPRLYGERDADFDGAVAEQSEVDAAYSALAREQAATDAEDRCQHHRGGRELNCRRQCRGHERSGIAPILDRGTEITVQRVGEPDEILFGKRLIEAHFVPFYLDFRKRRRRRKRHCRRVDGKHPQDTK